jgi:eukaryotic-like serine/threonine-protein kinase
MISNNSMLQGRYKIIDIFGNGGFGITYLAVDTKHGEQISVIVKEFSPKFKKDTKLIEEYKRWFKIEAKFLKDLGDDFRCIPLRYDSFEENENLYIVQQYIEGVDLSNKVKTGVTLTEESTIKIIKNILKPLRCIHERKIIHRDIKPNNLRVRKNDRGEDEIVLIDFGIAIKIGDVVNLMTELRGVGTPYYKPPEQREGKPTFASDIYPIGIIGLQAITGRSQTDLDSLRLPNGTIDPAAAAKIDASPQLIGFLNRALVHSLEKRFKNAIEALKYFEDYRTETTAPTDYDVTTTLPDPKNVVGRGSKGTLSPNGNYPQPQPGQTPIGKSPKENVDKKEEPEKTVSKKPWLIAIGAIVSIGGLLVGGWFIMKKLEWTTTPTDQYGVQLSYPSDWTIERHEPKFDMGKLAVLNPPEQKSECGDRVVIETREVDNSRPNPDELKSEESDRIRKSNDKEVKINDETTIDTRLSQRLAFQISYQREDSQCGFRKITEIGRSHNGRAYFLIYNADLKRFDGEKSTFDKIVSRLKLN